MRAVGSRDALEDLLLEAVLIEESLELMHNRRLFGLFDLDRKGEDLGDAAEEVFGIRIDETSHISWLRGVLSRLGRDLDEMEARRFARGREPEGPVPLETAFEEAIRTEHQVARYFEMLAESLRRSSIDDVRTEKLAEGFDRLADAERGHREALERIFDRYKDRLATGEFRGYRTNSLSHLYRLGE